MPIIYNKTLLIISLCSIFISTFQYKYAKILKINIFENSCNIEMSTYGFWVV